MLQRTMLRPIAIDMDAGIIASQHISTHCVGMRIRVPKASQHLFGSLLDSLEGVATHSAAETADELVIRVPTSMMTDFTLFLDAWHAFEAQASDFYRQEIKYKHGRQDTPDV